MDTVKKVPHAAYPEVIASLEAVDLYYSVVESLCDGTRIRVYCQEALDIVKETIENCCGELPPDLNFS